MKRLNAFCTYAAIAVICIGCYVGVFHTHHYYKLDLINWIYITITLYIVIIQMTSFQHHNHWMSKLMAFFTVIIIFFTVESIWPAMLFPIGMILIPYAITTLLFKFQASFVKDELIEIFSPKLT